MTCGLLSDSALGTRPRKASWGGGRAGPGARRRSNPVGSTASARAAGGAWVVDRVYLPDPPKALHPAFELVLPVSGRAGCLSGPTGSLGISKGRFRSLLRGLGSGAGG